MIRPAIFVLYSAIAVAQIQPEDPFDAANQAFWQARQKGQYDVATTHREEMSRLLQAEAADQPQFAGRAQSLGQAYDGDGMSATARTVLEGALARAEAAHATGQARAALLMALASYWERDRNLLKSLASLERAATALEQTPLTEDPPQLGDSGKGWIITGNLRQEIAIPGLISRGGFAARPGVFGMGPAGIRMSVYRQLADLYQRLGRRDPAAAVLAKMKALPAQSNNWTLAQYYQQHGDLEQAAAIYQKQMEEAQADPQQILLPADSLARVYEQMKRPADAEAILREAVTAIDASGKPELTAQSEGLRQRLAMLLYQNGHAEAADQAFPPPDDNSATAAGTIISYANYLGATKRPSQAEKLLADYLGGHPGLSANEQGNILMWLANMARMAGDSKRAEEYQLESNQKRLVSGPSADVVLIGPVLQKAQSEAYAGNTAEAIALVTQAIGQSENAQDRETLARMTPELARVISTKAPVQADELYRNVIAVVQRWSADTMLPWLSMLGEYPRFLMSLRRGGEAFPTIERYRAALKSAHGADSGWQEEPLRLTIELERGRNSPQAAILAAQNLLSLEETLDGPASEPLYRAAETLADLYRSTGDSARALPLYQQSIAIADAVFRADDHRRGQSRTNAAAVLIAEGRPEEAEPLVLEATQLRTVAPTGGRDGLTQMLEQIQAMKKSR